MTTAQKVLLAAFTLAASTSALAGDWEIDASHSSAQFSVRHMMVSTVRGNFQKVSGTAALDDQDLTRSKVDVTIDAASVDTRDATRDGHLKSAEFFDVAKYPTITFHSTKVEKNGAGYKVTGDLTMHGVTRTVVLLVDGVTAPQKNPWGKLVRGASATGKLNRNDFGLTWNKALDSGGVLIGDEVQLQLDVELTPKVPAPTATK